MNGRELLRSLADECMSGRETDHSYYDVIGTCFDICEALYWLDPNAVPSSWEYSPGMTSPGPSTNDIRCYSYGLYSWVDQESDAALTILLDLGVNVAGSVGRGGAGWDVLGWRGDDITVADRAEDALIYAGNILTRYADMIRPDGE